MTREDLLVLFDETTARARALLEAKNADYAQDGDALSNLKQSGAVNGDGFAGAWGHLSFKHWLGLRRAVGGLQLKSEAPEERAADLMNFAVLGLARIVEMRKETE